MPKLTRWSAVVALPLVLMLTAATAGAAESPSWACADEMPVYLHDLDPLLTVRVDAALRHLSDATGQHWYDAGATGYDAQTVRTWPSDEPARVISSMSSLSDQWRGNTVLWESGQVIVAVDLTLNLARLQGRAQTMKTLLHELAHMAGVEEHSTDPASPLYPGTHPDPGTAYTPSDVAHLAAATCTAS